LTGFEHEINEEKGKLAAQEKNTGASITSIPMGFASYVNKWGAPAGQNTLNYYVGATTGILVQLADTLNDALDAIQQVRARMTEVFGYYNEIRSKIPVGKLSLAGLISQAQKNPTTQTSANSLSLWYNNIVLTSNMRASLVSVNRYEEVGDFLSRMIDQIIDNMRMMSPNMNIICPKGLRTPGSTYTLTPFDGNVIVIDDAEAQPWLNGTPISTAVGNAEYIPYVGKSAVIRKTDVAINAGDSVVWTLAYTGCVQVNIAVNVESTLVGTDTTFYFRASVKGVVTTTTATTTGSSIVTQLILSDGDSLEFHAIAGILAGANEFLFEYSGGLTQCVSQSIVTKLPFYGTCGTVEEVVVGDTWAGMWNRVSTAASTTGFLAYVRELWDSKSITNAEFVWCRQLVTNPSLSVKYRDMLGLASENEALLYLFDAQYWFIKTGALKVSYDSFFREVYNDLNAFKFSMQSTNNPSLLGDIFVE
jgi:hypothetical protein